MVLLKRVKLLALLLSSFSSYANSIGDLGKTYPIKEKDMIKEMKERYSMKKDILKRDVRNSYVKYLNNPKGVKLPNAVKDSNHMVDLAYTLDRDIKDAHGKVIHKKGKKVNPFDHYSLNKKLCFINGKYRKHVKWAISKCSITDKIVLIQGKALDLMKSHKRRFYFDQRGVLVNKFKITALPALIAQKGRRLNVKEIYLP